MVGRKIEQELLQEAVEKDRAQFIVVYGRRRAGKTFLVNEFFQNTFAFKHTVWIVLRVLFVQTVRKAG